MKRNLSMKCTNCSKEFYSIEWLRLEPDLPLCDDCVIEVLEARKDVYENKAKETQEAINRVKEHKERKYEDNI